MNLRVVTSNIILSVICFIFFLFVFPSYLISNSLFTYPPYLYELNTFFLLAIIVLFAFVGLFCFGTVAVLDLRMIKRKGKSRIHSINLTILSQLLIWIPFIINSFDNGIYGMLALPVMLLIFLAGLLTQVIIYSRWERKNRRTIIFGDERFSPLIAYPELKNL